ncbi:MAG: hypothetical protein NUW12_00210 [Firmicutes bacterium]|jgi:hypothetical protein|nr:hypothetical protein [Bacillota bacterium]MDH7494373.1 hypothetical protein [Bacillota bacterium]
MKRMTLGTIALLGALAVVTVKLPSLLVRQSGVRMESGASAAGGDLLILLPRLESVSPLVINKERPSLPDLSTLSMSDLASRCEDPQDALQEAPTPEEQTDTFHDNAATGGADEGTRSGPLAGLRIHSRPVDDVESEREGETWKASRMNGLAWELPSASPPAPRGVSATPQARGGAVDHSASGALALGRAVPIPSADSPSRAATAGLSGDVPVGANARQAFVVLEEVEKRHPLWAELAAVEQEIEACEAEWRREVDASYLTEKDIQECYAAAERLALALATRGNGDRAGDGDVPRPEALMSEIDETEARLRDETEQRIAAYVAEVKQRLDDDLYAERARLNQELDAYRDKTLKEYFLSLFNAQLRLRLLRLSEDERKALQEKIAKLTVEMETKIDSKAREQDAVFEAYAQERCAAAEAEIAAMRAKEETSLSERIAKERAKLEMSLAEVMKDSGSSLREGTREWSKEIVRRARYELAAARERIARELAAKEADFTERHSRLQARRDALHRAICDDIRAAVRELGADMGLEVRVLERGASLIAAEGQAADVTERVLEIIRSR